MRRGGRLATLLIGAVLVTGCIGSIPRDEFEAEIRSRGGGFEEALLQDPIDDLADRLGTSDLQLMSLYASPESAIVTLQVRDPRNPRLVDRYTYRNGSMIDTEPVKVSVGDDLDADTMQVSDLALDELNEMIDEALAAYDTEGGFVSSVQAAYLPDPDEPGERILGFRMSLESPRSDATALFTADGELLGVEIQ